MKQRLTRRLARPAARGGSTQPGATRPDRADDRDVFVIHGRDERVREKVYELLRALDLHPLEWESIVAKTQLASPTLLEVIENAINQAQAILVLLTPDDVVHLHPALHELRERTSETAPHLQARPNVLIELGMALASRRDRTIIVEFGEMRAVADLSGINVIQFDGTVTAVGKLVERLKGTGCPVNDRGTDWRSPRRFADIAAYDRKPPLQRP